MHSPVTKFKHICLNQVLGSFFSGEQITSRKALKTMDLRLLHYEANIDYTNMTPTWFLVILTRTN